MMEKKLSDGPSKFDLKGNNSLFTNLGEYNCTCEESCIKPFVAPAASLAA